MRLGSTTENASRGDRSLRATIGQSDVPESSEGTGMAGQRRPNG